MKYDHTITLNLPRDRVIALFDDPDNLHHWLDGLLSYAHKSGERGYPGAVSEFVFENGKRRIEITETIETRDLPNEFTGIFTTDGMWNRSANYFTENADGTTVWRQENEFKGEGFMLRMMMLLIPGAFRKQSKKQMESFKAFAESA